MRKLLLGVLALGVAALPAMAQSAGAGGGQSSGQAAASGQAAGAGQGASGQQMPPPADPLATYVKNQFKTNANYLIKSAQEMPEEKYSVKLGTQPETRTFAGLMGHIIDANYFFCSAIKGEANPETFQYEKTAQTKAQITAAIQAAVDYCAPLYESLTDATAMQMVTPPSAAGRGPGRPVLRVAGLLRNVIHNNEEYGNLIGYFRSNNMVPPSSENQQPPAGRRGQ
jgi:uncharacterized damage-inducible protein DinB